MINITISIISIISIIIISIVISSISITIIISITIMRSSISSSITISIITTSTSIILNANSTSNDTSSWTMQGFCKHALFPMTVAYTALN